MEWGSAADVDEWCSSIETCRTRSSRRKWSKSQALCFGGKPWTHHEERFLFFFSLFLFRVPYFMVDCSLSPFSVTSWWRCSNGKLSIPGENAIKSRSSKQGSDDIRPIWEMSGSANGIHYLIRVRGFTVQEILDLLRIAGGADGRSSDGLLTVMLSRSWPVIGWTGDRRGLSLNGVLYIGKKKKKKKKYRVLVL